jgi:Holliday junction resolvase RusA-like endonuclease
MRLSDVATITRPARATMTFLMKRPQRPKWQLPGVRPDIDKLVRSTLDALTMCGALEDDALIVELRANQLYAPKSHPSGAWITLEEIEQ